MSLRDGNKKMSKSDPSEYSRIMLNDSSDEIVQKGKFPTFQSNNAGGILGGISSGQDIIVSFAVNPTSSILNTRATINKKGKNDF